MADGGTHRIMGAPKASPRLVQATSARSSLWASCRCGRTAVIDPAPWLAQGLGRQWIVQLEDRLRCVCGARRAPLEVRGLAEAPPGVSGGIYIFR